MKKHTFFILLTLSQFYKHVKSQQTYEIFNNISHTEKCIEGNSGINFESTTGCILHCEREEKANALITNDTCYCTNKDCSSINPSQENTDDTKEASTFHKNSKFLFNFCFSPFHFYFQFEIIWQKTTIFKLVCEITST